MTQSLGSLRSIAVLNQQENKTLSALAVQGRKDSQTMKALTTMATVYLPGSLIAVSLVLRKRLDSICIRDDCSADNIQLNISSDGAKPWRR